MNVLITGGTGFIGSRLALRCLENGDVVRVLGMTNNAAEAENRRRVEERGGETLVGSVTDAATVGRAVAGAEVIYHLAAAQHEANVPDRYFWDINVEGTRNLLEAAAAAGVQRFVHGSTIGVYGSAAEGQLDEDTPVRPDNIYGVTKAEGEKVVLSYADRLPVVVVRISEVYGPGDRRLLKLFRGIQKNMFVMIGKGDNLHQLIYVDDLVDGLLLAARSDRAVGRVVVLAGEEVLTTNEMVAAIADALGKPRAARLRAPLWPFMASAVVLETLLRPLGVQPPLHRRRMDFFRKNLTLSRERAQAMLGFEPRTSFRDGAAATVAWYRERGEL
jgi:dihydroflavonol-4-reductase